MDKPKLLQAERLAAAGLTVEELKELLARAALPVLLRLQG
jgi:hypothetical protein